MTDILLLVFLWAFLVFLLVSLTMIFVSLMFQFRWRVPFVPTPMIIVRTMLDLAELRPGQVVMDLGAGDGRFLFRAKEREPKIIAIGYEGALGIWLLGKFRIWLSGQQGIELRCRNFLAEDLSKADVLFLYLSMNVMTLLASKFEKELKPGTKIISHAFRLPGHEPEKTADIPMHFRGRTKAYRYIWR